jgi:hypothetical protein
MPPACPPLSGQVPPFVARCEAPPAGLNGLGDLLAGDVVGVAGPFLRPCRGRSRTPAARIQKITARRAGTSAKFPAIMLGKRDKIRNPKAEIRNKFEMANSNWRSCPDVVWFLEFSVCFGFRASSFEFSQDGSFICGTNTDKSCTR